MIRTLMLCAGTLLPALMSGVSLAQTHDSERHRFTVDVLTDQLSHPWGLAFLPDGRMLITERQGRLQLFDPEDSTLTPIEGIPPVADAGQGGLLDVALHPDFRNNRWVYLSYSAPGDRGTTTAVGRGRLRGERLTDFQVLFSAAPQFDSQQHYGSRLVFDRDGYLYITVGDRRQRHLAQDPDTHTGSVIRLTDDGEVPDDNPFVGRPDARPEIFSIGHRNPQGMTLHPETGDIWVHEHGPRGGDEINILRAGGNYGWPETTYGREYHGPPIGPDSMPGMAPPIHHWTPSIAPSGMTYYTGDAFPQWRNNIFVGALALTHLARLELDGERVTREERLLDDAGWRIRDVRQGPDGYLYLLVDAGRAPLLRLSPVDE